MKRTVIEMLKIASVKYSHAIFTSDKQENGWFGRTFSDVEKESDYFALALINRLFQKDDKIAIIAEGRGNWICAEFGILKAGCVSVPLSVKLQPDEILFRIQHSDSKAIIISKNNTDKLVPILETVQKKGIMVIYLDTDTETFDKISGSLENGNVVFYQTLTEEGKNAMLTDYVKLDNSKSNVNEDDTVTISYTSGTTGNPKGIMLTHLNYWANSHDALSFFRLTEYFRTLIILPLDHSFAHTVGTYIALLHGVQIAFVDSRGGALNTLKNIPINLKEIKPDFLLTVPALTGNFMKKICDGIDDKGGFVKWLFYKGLSSGIKLNGNGFKKADLVTKIFHGIPYKLADILIFKKVREIFGGKLQFCVGGGALLDIKQQQFFYTIGAPVYQGYGLTEATPIISANTAEIHKLGSSGKIIPGVTCRIVRSDGTDAKRGEKGQIVIKGLNVMKGYYNNPKASAEVLIDGWLYTGDMGYMDEDDFLIVVGREKALLISQDGEKYSPEEIEEAIANSSEFINQVMLYNDHSRYTTALITLEIGKLKAYKQKYKLTSEEQILNVIKDSFYKFANQKEFKNKFPEKWIPSDFRILEEAFTEQNHLINSTLKMVRHKITEVYQPLINQMYSAETKIFCDENAKVVKKILFDE